MNAAESFSGRRPDGANVVRSGSGKGLHPYCTVDGIRLNAETERHPLMRTLLRCLAIALIGIFAPIVSAQSTDESPRQYWMGDIETGSAANPLLPFMVTLWKEGDTWRGALDIPPGPGIGGAWWMELLSVDVSNERLELVQPPQRAGIAANTFAMVRTPPGGDVASGKLLVGGAAEVKARMWRVSEAESRDFMPRRPQYPRGELPYERRRVSLPSTRDGERMELDGILTLPKGEGPFPAVLLVNALDVHDVDHSSSGHKPYLVLADRLARAGIASLRTADRPLRMPGMAPQVQITAEMLGVEAAERVNWLASQPQVDGKRIAIVGLNEGAIAAAIAANRTSDAVRAIVLLAPQAISGIEQLRAEFAEAVRREGESSSFVEARAESFIKPYRLLTSGAARQEVVDAIDAEMTMQRAARRQQLGEASPEIIRGLAEQQFLIINTDPFKRNLLFDPAAVFGALKQPTLAILGERDARCPVSINRPALESSLGARSGIETRIVVLPGLNHRLQPSISGSVDEVQDLETTLDESALAACIEFLHRQFGITAKAQEIKP